VHAQVYVELSDPQSILPYLSMRLDYKHKFPSECGCSVHDVDDQAQTSNRRVPNFQKYSHVHMFCLTTSDLDSNNFLMELLDYLII